MASRTFSCEIERIAEWHPQLYLQPHIVASAAVMGRSAAAPCSFEVECQDIVSDWLGADARFQLQLSWTETTGDKAERLRRTMQPKSLAELAAVALTCVLTPNIVDLGQLDVTRYGERADYRSVNALCVVEMSGTENPREFSRRHRAKVEQALANPFGYDAYVVVCLFAPRRSRIRFSFHRQQGREE